MSGVAAGAVMAAILVMAGCGGQSVALPVQRRTHSGPELKEFGEFARLEDPHCAGNMVRGLRLSGRWAWTARRAELQYWVGPGPRRFTADIYIGVNTFKETGPVTISVLIEGKKLGELRCDAAHEFFFDKPVPDGWADTSRPVKVALEIDKPWVAPDGTEYGFLLVSAGFMPR